MREIEEKADRLERERESESRRATAEEQARIARELHDIVAHALSVIVAQSGAADDAFERDPAQAREPIRAINSAARAALADLRRVLGILQDSAEYEPQPGLDQLDGLVEQIRATGLDVSLEVEGAPRPDLEVVGEAEDGVQAVALVEELEPDVVLLDIRMPNLDGIEAGPVSSPTRYASSRTGTPSSAQQRSRDYSRDSHRLPTRPRNRRLPWPR